MRQRTLLVIYLDTVNGDLRVSILSKNKEEKKRAYRVARNWFDVRFSLKHLFYSPSGRLCDT